jgi:hypothetical protein
MGALGFGSIPGLDLANPSNALRFGRTGDPFLEPHSLSSDLGYAQRCPVNGPCTRAFTGPEDTIAL